MTVAPVRVLVFQNRFLIGGQERQIILHLRTIDRSQWEPVLACLHPEGEHLAEVERMGMHPEVFDVGRKMLRPGTFWQIWRVAQLVRRERIALVHAQDLYTNVLGTAAARIAGVPSIVTRVDLAHAVEGYRRPLLTAASRAASRVLVNALCIRDLCMRDGVAADRIVVVRNGVDLEELDRAAAAVPADPAPDLSRPTAVMVANMHHPVKGQSDVLLAMRQVLRGLPEAQLLLVGDGVRRPLLERQARELGVAERCRFLGHRLDVPALLARSTCAVSASYAEGISNSILEAMALRVPVVGTAAGGTSELVRDGKNGFLVAPGAPAQLAVRISALLRDGVLRRRMAELGRRIVEREFSLDQMRLAYDALYRELCGVADAAPLARAS